MKRSGSSESALSARVHDEDDDDLDCLPRIPPGPALVQVAPLVEPNTSHARPTPRTLKNNSAKSAHAIQTPSASPRHVVRGAPPVPLPLPLPLDPSSSAKRRRVRTGPRRATNVDQSNRERERVHDDALVVVKKEPELVEEEDDCDDDDDQRRDDDPGPDDAEFGRGDDHDRDRLEDTRHRPYIATPHSSSHHLPRRRRCSSTDDRVAQWQQQQQQQQQQSRSLRRHGSPTRARLNPVPNLESFIHSLDLPRLQRLVGTFHALGIEAAEDVLALASTTTVGIRRRDAIWDLVAEMERRYEREFTEFERKTIELHLEEGSQTWTRGP